MPPDKQFDQRYIDGDLPWDTGRPDHHLAQIIRAHHIEPCQALEIGCGTGTNSVWLAQQGFQVTALDLAPTAIRRAEARAAAAGVQVALRAADFMADDLPDGPFAFVFDRGVLHGCDRPADRATFAQRVAARLAPDGLWLSFIGSADAPPRQSGPPRLSAAEVVLAVEPYYQLLLLQAGHFDSDQPVPAPAWLCLMRKRLDKRDIRR